MRARAVAAVLDRLHPVQLAREHLLQFAVHQRQRHDLANPCPHHLQQEVRTPVRRQQDQRQSPAGCASSPRAARRSLSASASTWAIARSGRSLSNSPTIVGTSPVTVEICSDALRQGQIGGQACRSALRLASRAILTLIDEDAPENSWPRRRESHRIRAQLHSGLATPSTIVARFSRGKVVENGGIG